MEKEMILQVEEIKKLSQKTRTDLLMVLYNVEDELDYESKNVSNTIDYLQKYNKKGEL